MGVKFTEAVLLDYEQLVVESDNVTPLTCFLTMGSDPTENIERMARSKGIRTWPLV